MAKIDPGIYSDILHVRQAWRFDAAAFLMRFYGYMYTIGTVTMMTLSGYSAFQSGLVASALAIMTFLLSPRVSKLIDEKSQHRVVPPACIVTLVGLAALIAAVILHLPFWVCACCTVPIGFMPSPGALARARWTYLVHTERFGAGNLDLRSVFSYEGILDDVAFAASPAISIALAAAIHPVAGMAFGGICCLAGSVILMGAKNTEPEVGWKPLDEVPCEETASPSESGDAGDGRLPEPTVWDLHPNRSCFRLSGTVRVLFTAIFLLGILFGTLDTSTVVFCQAEGNTTAASWVMAMSGVVSALCGFTFGMLRLDSHIVRILVVTTVLFGIGYFTSMFICNIPTLFVFIFISSLFYAPFFITVNTVCERAVPGSRITEGITWLTAGVTCGMAIGPSMGGWICDHFGGAVGFDVVGIVALMIPAVVLICLPLLKRDVR